MSKIESLPAKRIITDKSLIPEMYFRDVLFHSVLEGIQTQANDYQRFKIAMN